MGDAAGELSPTERAEAQRYGRTSLVLAVSDMALDVVYLAIMAFVFARPLDTWLAGFPLFAGDDSLLRLMALFGVVVGIHILVSLPLSFYAGYVVEHRFKLSNQSIGRWVTTWLKRNAFGIVLGAAIYAGLYWMIWHTGNYWWLIAAGVFFLFSVILGQLAPVVFLPLFYKIERLDDAALTERMDKLAAGTGLTIEGVYRMGLSADTVKANAMLAGLGRTRRVLMGDTLLEKFSPDEIEVIFAHEIGHHVHRHIPKMIAAGVLFSLVGFWLLDQLLVWWAGVPTAAECANQQPAAGDVCDEPLRIAHESVAKRDQPPLRTAMRPLRARRAPATATRIAARSKSWPGSTRTTRRQTRWRSFSCIRTHRSQSGWRWRIEGRVEKSLIDD